MENRIDRIVILPEKGSEFTDQFEDCLQQIDKYTDWTGSQIIQQSFFINAKDNKTYLILQEEIKARLSESGSQYSTSIIAQSPATGHTVSVELVLLTDPPEDLKLSHAMEQGVYYTVLSSISKKELYVGGISASKPFEPLIDQIEDAYALLEAILRREGMYFSDIARQWNYVEGILSEHDIGNDHVQNYQILNDVRSEYYGKSSFENGYPAATGIGMNAGGIILEIYAVKPHDELMIVPIKNPKQIDAYQYSESVLGGNGPEHNKKKTTPKFERAKFVGKKDAGTVYVSGTASIHNEKTIEEDDVALQTKITIENIANLVDKTYLNKLGIHANGSVEYKFIRVYIKNEKDVVLVKEICDTQYPDIPVHYLVADVCRNNLLLEIEGVIDVL